MGWFSRKLDSLVGAIFAGVGGAAASQLDIFVQQYLQRLGGHRDEAQRYLTAILDSDRYRDLAPAARQIVLDDVQARVAEIDVALHAIAGADILIRPFAFLRHVDMEIATRTFEQFRPALPLDLPGLIYAGCGLALGLIVYEIIKAPFAMVVGRRRIGR